MPTYELVNDNPAESLSGLRLDHGWIVGSLQCKAPGATGGNFSKGYLVENVDGRKGYLKALDYSFAHGHPEPSEVLAHMTSAYEFEKRLCDKVRRHGMSKVVSAITYGRATVHPTHAFRNVQYLIFERADGDIRACIDDASTFTIAWALRSLHHTATGLRQLHTQGIAHQDLKPSNVLVFQRRLSKVADLGSASYQNEKGARDRLHIPGDPTYAPPELLYNHLSSDWRCRRVGCDLYLLGSLATFLFTRCSMSHLLHQELRSEHRHGNWGGTYAEVLPYVRHAFGRTIQRVRSDLPPLGNDTLIEAIEQLCDPDPALRGHPHERILYGQRYSLRRYVSLFDLLATRAEYSLQSVMRS